MLLFEDGLEYGIYLVTIGTVEAFVDEPSARCRAGCGGSSNWGPVYGGGRRCRRGRGGTGCSTWRRSDVLVPWKAVEVLGKAEAGMLPRLDQSVFLYEESPLLNVVPFKGEVLAVVSHFRLQIGVGFLYQSVNELPNTYRNDSYAKVSSEGEGVGPLPATPV